MTPELEAKIRAEFEKWVQRHGPTPNLLEMDETGAYEIGTVQDCWNGFIAGRASVLAELEHVGEYDGYGLSDIANESPKLNHNDKLYRLGPELRAVKEKK